jgi:hypothetical protein
MSVRKTHLIHFSGELSINKTLVMIPQIVSSMLWVFAIFIASAWTIEHAWSETLNEGSTNDSNFLSVTDARFGAKGDLRTCTDAQTTNGSLILFSPKLCNFSFDDVNKWVQVPLAGDSFGTGLSGQIVSVRDSQHAEMSVPAGSTVTAAVKTFTDLAISSYAGGHGGQYMVSSVSSPFTTDRVGSTLTITGGTGFTPKTVTIIGVSYDGTATLSAAIGAPGSKGGTGTSPLSTTIATGDYKALTSAAAYMCSHPGVLRFPPGTYYIEKYRIYEGPHANGVQDITWTNCQNVTIQGYGATISSNGSFRRAADSSETSYCNSVSPFRIINSNSFTIQGIELNGNVDKMTKAGGVVEGQDYGIITGGSKNLTIRDVDSHHWPTDGMVLGLLQAPQYAADKNILLDNVWSHNNGRMGLTLSSVNGAMIVNYRCSQIGQGFTGTYGGHAPGSCVDIEPPTLGDVMTGNILFSGGYQAASAGVLFDVTPGINTDVTVDGVTFDCSMKVGCNGGAIVGIAAKRTLIKNSTFYTKFGASFSCGQPYYVAGLERIDIVNNRLILQSIPEIACGTNDGRIKPTHFVGNHVVVTGNDVHNGAIRLDHLQEVRGNDFFISKNAMFAGSVNVINYKDAETVADNVYETDMTNIATPWAADYTNVRFSRNERSQNPGYFAVTPNSGGGNMTFAGNLRIMAPATPAMPTVACIGTCAGPSFQYKVVGIVGHGNTAASASGTVKAGPTTFSTTSYNTIKWDYTPGIDTYDVYCTLGCSKTGKINAQPVSINYFIDNVGEGDGSTVPVSASELGEVYLGTTGLASGALLQVGGGGIQIVGATQPHCDATHRGAIWYFAGAAGVKDTVNVCAKDAADTYFWRVLY